MITLQFSTTRHPASALIRWGTWSWASHVDLVLPDGSLYGAIPGGVRYHEASPLVTRAERYEVDAPLDELRIVIESQWGKPYDWPGIIGWGLRRDWQEDDAWFCSELIAWGFQQIGRPLLRADKLHRITPRDLLLSPLLQKA